MIATAERRRLWTAAALFFVSVGACAAQDPAPVQHPRPLRDVRVITFGGASNLPTWAAQRQGFFAQEGLEVRVTFAPNSVYQMTQLLAGNYDIAMTAMDDAVAYQEGQNEALIGPNPVLFVFAGTDNSFLDREHSRHVSRSRGKDLRCSAVAVRRILPWSQTRSEGHRSRPGTVLALRKTLSDPHRSNEASRISSEQNRQQNSKRS